ncbi:MAG: AAA family ATPase [Rhodobiaceae bacterium]|nr:AAA family ATPase [Rhodobiaceae bacterium]
MSSHPLEDISIRVRNFKCFGSEGGSFEPFAPINIIIGRNNSGKSALIDAIDVCVSEERILILENISAAMLISK